MADLISVFCIRPTSSLNQVIACIDGNGEGIALVVDKQHRLLGTVTDGDIRRAILAGTDLDSPVSSLLEKRAVTARPSPLTALEGTSQADILHVMNTHGLRHVPIVDRSGRVVDIFLLSQLTKEHELPLTAAVMAGGFGTRLRPLTDEEPKPMLPVGDRPLLELIIEQLRDAGIRRVSLTTHYKGDAIAQHFGDGQDFGVEIEYIEETHPLGTAGALSLVQPSKEPLLVMNGDLLTRVDLRAMLDFHQKHQAHLTVAVKEQQFQIPYGVVELEGVQITGISEKPSLRHFINAGIYLLSPEAVRCIPKGQPYDMPDLIGELVSKGLQVVGFPLREYWLDVGKVEDYAKAQADVKDGLG